jgi:hypothetical protein
LQSSASSLYLFQRFLKCWLDPNLLCICFISLQLNLEFKEFPNRPTWFFFCLALLCLIILLAINYFCLAFFITTLALTSPTINFLLKTNAIIGTFLHHMCCCNEVHFVINNQYSYMHVGPKIDPLKENWLKSLKLLVLGIFEHVTISAMGVDEGNRWRQ